MNSEKVKLDKLHKSMLAFLYRYSPEANVRLIGDIVVRWGALRVNDEASQDTRCVAMLFCRYLGDFVSDTVTVRPSRRPGVWPFILARLERGSVRWAKQWNRLPFDLAITEFTLTVYEWLRTVDLERELDDDSPNQIYCFARRWFYELGS
jgi:hypothetical protein